MDGCINGTWMNGRREMREDEYLERMRLDPLVVELRSGVR